MPGTPDILRRQTETRQLKVNRRKRPLQEDVIDSHARMMEIEYPNSCSPSDLHVDIKTTLEYFDELGLFLC